jgi:hypothetical protein
MAARRGLVAAMADGYRAPRASMERMMASGLQESRALFYLMAGCGLLFVASTPRALRSAAGIEETETPVAAAVGAHLFAFLFLAPVLLYILAPVVRRTARAFGGRGTPLATRTALFWSVLLGGPIALAIALAGMLAEVAAGPAVLPWIGLLGYAGFAVWLWLFASCLAEAEGFRHSGRVAAVVAASFGLVAGLLAALAGGAAA